MGLEAGWNCHISLLNDKAAHVRSDTSLNASHSSHRSADSGTTHHAQRRSVMLHLRVVDETRTKHRRRSAPGIVSVTNSHSDLNMVNSVVTVAGGSFLDPLLPDRSNDDIHDDVMADHSDSLMHHEASPIRSLLSGSFHPELNVVDCGGGGDSDAASSYMTDYTDSVIDAPGMANTVSDKTVYLSTQMVKTELAHTYKCVYTHICTHL